MGPGEAGQRLTEGGEIKSHRSRKCPGPRVGPGNVCTCACRRVHACECTCVCLWSSSYLQPQLCPEWHSDLEQDLAHPQLSLQLCDRVLTPSQGGKSRFTSPSERGEGWAVGAGPSQVQPQCPLPPPRAASPGGRLPVSAGVKGRTPAPGEQWLVTAEHGVCPLPPSRGSTPICGADGTLAHCNFLSLPVPSAPPFAIDISGQAC